MSRIAAVLEGDSHVWRIVFTRASDSDSSRRDRWPWSVRSASDEEALIPGSSSVRRPDAKKSQRADWGTLALSKGGVPSMMPGLTHHSASVAHQPRERTSTIGPERYGALGSHFAGRKRHLSLHFEPTRCHYPRFGDFH